LPSGSGERALSSHPPTLLLMEPRISSFEIWISSFEIGISSWSRGDLSDTYVSIVP